MSAKFTKKFLNDDTISYTSVIFTKINRYLEFEIAISDCQERVKLHQTSSCQNDIYKLNTLVQALTELRDDYVFLLENEEKADKEYTTREEAEQVLQQLKEAQPMFFEEVKVVEVNPNKKAKPYFIMS